MSAVVEAVLTTNPAWPSQFRPTPSSGSGSSRSVSIGVAATHITAS